ncbi:DUF427 domain-containing protein [Radicibacter daui]|uniref:DUF427 domain-containing protein n=1 Tax=Radicibacter daui TaxID=3064829 RepID=UPI004046E849
MIERPVLEPGPDHPITIVPAGVRVTVTSGGKIIADSARALVLDEAHYPSVYYIPRDDADMALLESSPHRSYCPYKGEASYFNLPAGGEKANNAVWSYEAPHAAVKAIAGYLAFYTDRVDSLVTRPVR